MRMKRSAPVLPLFPLSTGHQPELQAAVQPRAEPSAHRVSGKLRERVALITRAESATGRAVALLYAREGADLALVHSPAETRAVVETELAVRAEGRRCLLLPGEATDPEFCSEVVRYTVRELGRLDVLVNNAVFQEHRAGLEAISDAQWDRTFRCNIDGYFYMTRAALPHLSEGSSIINCGGVTGGDLETDLVDYAVVSGAIEAFTHALARTLRGHGIRANCVANTRSVDPERIAPTFVFLASEGDSPQINGEVLTFVGGDTPV